MATREIYFATVFSVVLKNELDLPKSIAIFFSILLTVNLVFTEISVSYGATLTREYQGGLGLLSHYQGSHVKALMEMYPDLGLRDDLFYGMFAPPPRPRPAAKSQTRVRVCVRVNGKLRVSARCIFFRCVSV